MSTKVFPFQQQINYHKFFFFPRIIRKWNILLSAVVRTRKSTQVNASLQNQNLRTDLRRVAKRIHKSAHKSKKAVNLTHIIG